MTQNNLFGICIPTYNRANELKKCILSFLDEAKKYNIPIYIHDNNSTDDTDKLIETFKKEYKYIFYKKNKENLGIDKNMLSVINMAETKYALWLGSDDTLSSNAITLILDKLKEQPDLCLLDRKNTVDVLKSSYDNPFDFYQDNGQIGNTGMHFSTLIVKVDDTKKAIQEDGNRYIGTLHAYAGVILDYLITNYKKNNKLNIITIKDFIINIATQNKSWERESLEVYYLYIPRWFKLLKKEYKTNEKVKNEYIRYLKRFKLPRLIKKSETLTGGGAGYSYFTFIIKLKIQLNRELKK